MQVGNVNLNPSMPDDAPKKMGNDEASFLNCVWDQNSDGNYDTTEAENAARTALCNEFGQ